MDDKKSSSKVVGKYRLERTIGSGSYAKVKYAVDTETGEAVAVKVIEKDRINTPGMAEQLKREITAMKLMKHSGVVEIKEVLATTKKIYIVMDLVIGGDLLDRIEAAGYLDEESALFYFRSMVEATDKCHQQDICHRDLKPENMLISADNQIKITDFGMSVLNDHAKPGGQANLLDTVCGTPNYVAPEVLEGKGYDGKKADVWSLGCILYVMLCGALPFDGPKNTMFPAILKGQHEPFPAHVSKHAQAFIKQILTVSPDARLTIEGIKAHPFFSKYTSAEDAAAVAAASGGSSKPKLGLSQLLSVKAHLPYRKKTPTSEPSEPTPMSMGVLELVTVGLGLDIASGLEAANTTTTGGDRRSKEKGVFRFATTHQPQAVLSVMADALTELGIESVRVVQATFRLKGEMDHITGLLKFTIRVIQLLPPSASTSGVYMIETTKTQGSTKVFNAVYAKFAGHPAIQAVTERP
eukprot:c12322_g1_i1.p1 GENE.c12322_g1_i1~~c12322_g1_i1.p1  ORF type:complete len:467 (+),score=145.02 c12322_g1_i1:55-1455(+)